MKLKPIILEAEPNRELRWRGSLPIPELFIRVYIFTIQSLDKNAVQFIHREIFSGLLIPLIKKWLNTFTKKGFESMNQALRILAESIT
ncbi:hypothetical protein [Nodularia sp. NIES-3585]|uniref:hypothetical protein n=1 Tax=Nodularia sp. NIES-3585 TaxID=1973477 RepID=UPI000B6DC6AE|nr:hypothetical protein [Nodularia sp. NIES-3585]GAX37911.1 activator of Hsp90 ATPase 1 family protein [Nodularia sp. NIES-3585]